MTEEIDIYSEDAEGETPLLPYYVYVLADLPQGESFDSEKVFYVGKGQGKRVGDHKKEESRKIENGQELEHQKHQKLKEIREGGRAPLELIIGRYETEDEAFAVETTLINWVHGYSGDGFKLTNANRGRNGIIRPRGKIGEIAGIDIPKRANVRDGTFRDRNVETLARAGAYEFLNEIESALTLAHLDWRDFSKKEDRPYHPGEANGHLGLMVRLEGIDFVVDVTPRKVPQIWVATTDSTVDHAYRLAAIGLKMEDANNIAVRGRPRYVRYRPALRAENIEELLRKLQDLGESLRGKSK